MASIPEDNHINNGDDDGGVLPSWIWSYVPTIISGGYDDHRVGESSTSSSSSGKHFDRSSSFSTTRDETATECTSLLTKTKMIMSSKLLPPRSSSDNCCFLETSAAVNAKLNELDCELQRFPDQALAIYNFVVSQQEDTLLDFIKRLKTLMLRSDQWEAGKAAVRLLSYLDAKLKWFGRHGLLQPLSIHQADRGTMECLQSGIFQAVVLGQREKHRSATTVLVIFPALLETIPVRFISVSSLVKAWWLFVAMVLRDGYPKNFIGVIYDVPRNMDRGGESSRLHPSSLVDPQQLLWHGICSLRQLPLHTSSWHYCHDKHTPKSEPSQSWFSSIQPMTSATSTSYFPSSAPSTMDTGSKVGNQFWQVHQGSETELLYQLLEHGIASQNLPDMNNFDEKSSAKHRQWLHRMANVALEL